MADRAIVYDDQDLNTTQYNGQWFAKISAEENIGNFGPPYLDTLHGTNHDAKVIFEFNGTAIGVYGTSIVANPMTNPDPTFECFVDGVSIGREPVFEFPENNFKLCGRGGYSDGLHTLEIDIKVQSPDQTFWLDQIRYIPSPSIPLDGKMILVRNTDPAIRLDENWRSLANFNATSITNATAHVDFFGTSVSWVGYFPTELPHESATGTYSIDGDDPVDFNLVGLSGDQSNSEYNQVFFTTPEVNIGPHTLTVTFLGSQTTTPLTLDHLYINNGSLVSTPVTTSVISTISGPTATTNSDIGTRPGPNINAILGGIIGGLGLLILIAGAVLCRRHRRLSRKTLVSAFGGDHAPRHCNSHGEFQASVGPNDVSITPALPPNPSMKAEETYTHGSTQPPPVKSLSAKQREASRFARQSSYGWTDGL